MGPLALHFIDHLCDVKGRLGLRGTLLPVDQVKHLLHHLPVHQAIALFREPSHEELKLLHREFVIVIRVELLECLSQSLLICALTHILI